MCDVSDTEITGNVQIAGTAIDSFQCLSYFDDTCSDSAAQVDDFSVRCGRIDRFDDRGSNILYVDEVAAFLAVFKDIDVFIVQKQ